ncbi:MAG: hypothetical protein HYX34_05450 [Actinobacteria bacterium]|nr:hypothetical protein [Actinomycetota bacterium]
MTDLYDPKWLERARERQGRWLALIRNSRVMLDPYSAPPLDDAVPDLTTNVDDREELERFVRSMADELIEQNRVYLNAVRRTWGQRQFDRLLDRPPVLTHVLSKVEPPVVPDDGDGGRAHARMLRAVEQAIILADELAQPLHAASLDKAS